MLPKPDAQNLTRLKITLGLLLCVVGLTGPALVLRETSVLEISQQQLNGLTPIARTEIKRRQRISRGIGIWGPRTGVVVLILGTALVISAVPKLRSQEKTDDRRALAEVSKLEAELQPQTAEERRRTVQDAAVEWFSTEQADNRDYIQFAEEFIDTFHRVTLRLSVVAPVFYDFQSEVKVTHKPHDLLLDGLYYSAVDELDDVLVEIKTTGHRSVETLWDVMALERCAAYAAATGRRARAWVVVVVDDDDPSLPTTVGTKVQMTYVSQRAIDQLEFPTELLR